MWQMLVDGQQESDTAIDTVKLIKTHSTTLGLSPQPESEHEVLGTRYKMDPQQDPRVHQCQLATAMGLQTRPNGSATGTSASASVAISLGTSEPSVLAQRAQKMLSC